jgi:hypothetical protein
MWTRILKAWTRMTGVAASRQPQYGVGGYCV